MAPHGSPTSAMLCAAMLAALAPCGTPAPSGPTTLTATGSSMLCPLMAAWREDYVAQTGVNVTYACSGSGVGKGDLVANRTDFAGTDSLFSEAQYAAAPDVQLFPAVVVPVALVFNLGEGSTVTLDVPTAADIFKGLIEYWDDPRITHLSSENKMLPHVRITVVVRLDKSGTTEIVTTAFRNYNAWEHTPSPVFPLGMVPPDRLQHCHKSSGVRACVKATYGSISYHGISGVLSAGMRFAVIINGAGKVTIPGWADGDDAATSVLVEAKTLIGTMPGTTGYPLAGLSYVATRMGSPGACAALSFFVWLLTSPDALKVTANTNLVPVSPATVNRAFDVMHHAGCDILGIPVQLNCRNCGALKPLLNSIAYSYRKSHVGQFVRVSDPAEVDSASPEQEALLEVVPESQLGVWSDNPEYSVFPIAIRVDVMACNFGVVGAGANWNLGVGLIRSLVAREVTLWSDPAVRTPPSYVPFFPANVTLVADRSLKNYAAFVEKLGLDPAVHRPHLILPHTNDVVRFLKETPGAIAFLDYASSSTWGLSVANPVQNGFIMTPSLSALTAVEGSILTYDSSRGSFNVSEVEESKLYPYYRVVFMAVRRNVQGEVCRTEHAQLIRWVASTATEDLWRDVGYHPLISGVVKDRVRAQLATLRCNGAYIFPELEEGGGDDNTTVIIIAGSVGGFVVLCTIAAAVVARRQQAAKLEKVYGAATVAAEMAEAIAVLNFDQLVKLHNVKKPDRVQLAMRNILVMMSEFIRYVPPHVVKAARGECLDDSSDNHSAGSSDAKGDLALFQFGGGDAVTRLSGAMRDTNDAKKADALGFKKALLASDRKACKTIALALRSKATPQARSDEARQGLLALVGTAADQLRGLIHSVSEDRIVITWGTSGNLSGTANINATRCAVRLAKEGVSCGVHCSMAGCLYLGTAAVQTFHVLGGVIEDADVLSRAAEAASAPVVVSEAVAFGSWKGRFTAARFPSVASATGGRAAPLAASVVFGTLGEADGGEEWMYETHNDKEEGVAGIRTAVALLSQGDPEGAQAVLSQVVSGAGVAHGRFVAWLDGLVRAAKSGDGLGFVEVSVAGSTFSSVSVCCNTLEHGTTVTFEHMSFANLEGCTGKLKS